MPVKRKSIFQATGALVLRGRVSFFFLGSHGHGKSISVASKKVDRVLFGQSARSEVSCMQEATEVGCSALERLFHALAKISFQEAHNPSILAFVCFLCSQSILAFRWGCIRMFLEMPTSVRLPGCFPLAVGGFAALVASDKGSQWTLKNGRPFCFLKHKKWQPHSRSNIIHIYTIIIIYICRIQQH